MRHGKKKSKNNNLANLKFTLITFENSWFQRNKAIRYELKPLNTFVLRSFTVPLDKTSRPALVRFFNTTTKNNNKYRKPKTQKSFARKRCRGHFEKS